MPVCVILSTPFDSKRAYIHVVLMGVTLSLDVPFYGTGVPFMGIEFWMVL